MFPRGTNGLTAVSPDQLRNAYLIASIPDPINGKNTLWAQRLQGNSLHTFGDGLLVSSVPSNQGQAVATADNANGVILAWYYDQRGNTPKLDILAQRISSTRQVLWAPAGVPMCRVRAPAWSARSPSRGAVRRRGFRQARARCRGTPR